MKRIWMVACALAVVGPALAACGGAEDVAKVDAAEAAGGDPKLQELIEAAQDEGSLVWYCARSETIATAVSNAFAEKYGIDAEYVRLASGDIAQRFASESDADAVASDVLFTSDDDFVAAMSEQERVISLAEADIPGYPGILPPESVKYDGRAATVQIAPWSFAYNTDLVPEDEVPSSWEDLLDPRWKGEILMPDPNVSDAYIMQWAAVRRQYGDEFLRAFAAQEPTITASSSPALEALAAGEAKLAVPGLADSLATLKSSGAPVESIQPDFATGTELVVAIADGAPNPNAAKLFAHFLMSEEGNAVLNDFEGIAGPADTEGLPSEFVPQDFSDISQRDEIMELLGL